MTLKRRKLIGEAFIERLKVFGQDNNGLAFSVCGDVAVVDVHHVGAFNRRVIGTCSPGRAGHLS